MSLVTREIIHDLYYNQGYPRTAITAEYGYAKSVVAYHLDDKSKTRAAELIRARKNRLLRFVEEIKRERGCSRCPEKHPACLDFHHRDPSQKLFSISNGASQNRYSEDKLLIEIEKCDIICSNCHRKEHYVPIK